MSLKNLFGLIIAMIAGMLIVYGAPASLYFLGIVGNDWAAAWSAAAGLVLAGALAIKTLVFQ